jgi:translation machinery-associated protein 16
LKPNNRKHTLKNIKGKHKAHPYSRKANQIHRSILRQDKIEHQKKQRQLEHERIVERYLWFKNELDSNVSSLSQSEFDLLVKKYFSRHDMELERLREQRKYGKRPKSTREELLETLKVKEQNDYLQGVLDIPDLTNPIIVKALRDWDGQYHSISLIRQKL